MIKIKKLDVACPNKHCKAYNKVGLRNIVRNSSQSNGTQKYKCIECGRNLVRTINTPFFHKHLSKKEIIRICKMLAEKTSFRAIARITNLHSPLLQRKRSWRCLHLFGLQKKNSVLHLLCRRQME